MPASGRYTRVAQQTAIPPERQSSRLRETQIPNFPVAALQQNLSQTESLDVLENQYSEDGDYDPSGDEDDGCTFKTAVKLPHSEVSKKKLGELVGKFASGVAVFQLHIDQPSSVCCLSRA